MSVSHQRANQSVIHPVNSQTPIISSFPTDDVAHAPQPTHSEHNKGAQYSDDMQFMATKSFAIIGHFRYHTV